MKEKLYRIRPFKEFKTSDVLEALRLASPRIGSFPTVRDGVKKALQRLRDLSYGQISREDALEVKSDIMLLQSEAEYAMAYAVTVVANTTIPLRDYAEYRAFSDICLPMNASSGNINVWGDHVKEGVRRHFSTITSLKDTVKSAPKYRKKGHDYCEDMVEMIVRIVMRPGLVRFTKKLERALGWPSIDSSGILKYVDMKKPQ